MVAKKTKQLTLTDLKAQKKALFAERRLLVKAEDAAITATDKNQQEIERVDERIRYFVGEDLGNE